MFGSIGMPELLILSFVFVPLVVAVVLAWRGFRGQRGLVKAGGHASLMEYLRAAPQTDAEKRAAVDLALKGLVICLLGLLMPPLLIVGILPLFFGVRKIIYASMGLGLVDDARR